MTTLLYLTKRKNEHIIFKKHFYYITDFEWAYLFIAFGFGFIYDFVFIKIILVIYILGNKKLGF